MNPFQTLKVVNGLPSSAYATTEDTESPTSHGLPLASPSRLTPGARNTPAWSPLNPIPNPFESAFSPPSSQRASGEESRQNETITMSPITPLRVRARKPVPPIVTTALSVRQPMTVAPEDIDGMPFPTTPTIVREGTHLLSIGPEMFTQNRTTEKRMGPPVNIADPAQIVHPSIPTLEKAASIAIFFETLYHALLKPPPTLQAAHPDNYACARERRRLALEDEMEQRQLTEAERQNLRQRWVEAETNNLRERRRRVGLNSFAKMKVIGHGKSRCRFPMFVHR